MDDRFQLLYRMGRLPRRLLLALACVLPLAGPGLARAATCDPAVSCCPGGDPGGDPGCSGGGNPVHVLTGNKFQRDVDMPALPGVLGLELVRTYNSVDSRASTPSGVLGRGWRLSYDIQAVLQGPQLDIVVADGGHRRFIRGIANPQRFVALDASDGEVDALPGGGLLWRRLDGLRHQFDAAGRLTQIQAASGEFLSLTYDARGWLVQVQDPQGRRLQLHYLDKAASADPARFRGVQAIDSPVGRFQYGYGSGAGAAVASLVRVQPPATAGGPVPVWRYHYEDPRFPTLLTGSSLEGQGADGRPAMRRLNTFAYDASGRAVLTVRGEPGRLQRGADGRPLQPARLEPGTGEDQVLFERAASGEVVAFDREGRRTVFRQALIAGVARLVEVRGAGCAHCPPTNRRLGYDAQGRLTDITQLSPAGQPLATEHRTLDPQGRVLAVQHIGYRDGRPQAPQLQVRMAYAAPAETAGDAGLALREQRPSVVPGQVRLLTRRFNAEGQLVERLEQGWSPRDAEGREQPVALERRVQYRYERRNGRSLLVEIQGPGAGRTRLDWDAGGRQVVAVHAPGGAQVGIERDDAGRWSRLVREDGGLHQVLEARREAATGQSDGPVEVRQTAWWQAPGGEASPRLMRVLRLPRDGLGQLLGLDIDGRRIDTGGAALMAQAALAGTAVDTAATLDTGVALDEAGRPVLWRDTAGQPVLALQWGEGDPRARQTVMALQAGGTQAERVMDDWGRVVAIRNPYQGWQTAAYDNEDHLLARRDPRGARELLQRDEAGRLRQLLRYAPGQAAPEQTLRWVDHADGRLEERIQDADGERLTTTRWDALGRPLSQTLQLRPAGALAQAIPPLSLQIDELLDEQGQLRGRRLTDATGQRLDLMQRLDDAGRVVALDSPGVLPAWLGGAGHLVTGIDWQHLPGLDWARSIRHADGTVEQFGALAPGEAGGGGGTPPSAAVTASTGPTGANTAASGAWQVPGRDADAAGLPAAVVSARGEQGLVWNAAGQLRASTRGPQDRTDYVYDARGRRVLAWRHGAGRPQVSLSLYDDRHRLLAQADGQGRLQQAYAWVGYRAVAQLDLQAPGLLARWRAWWFGAPAHALHTGPAGQVLRMVDGSRVLWSADAAAGPAAHQPLRHVGQVLDEDSGLVYHGARFLEPGIGRFLSPDPAGIADAVNAVGAPRLLDLYAFAGGQPDRYFDPDGAARIRYFAVTTGADGKALGTDQGYTKARWSFIVDRVAAPSGLGGDATLRSLQQKYADNQQSLLVDAKGDFLKGTSAETWLGEGGVSDLFKDHYGDHLISAPEFTVTMDDADATRLIASYIAADRAVLYPGACPLKAALLPPIRFAAEETPIIVTAAANGDASKQRILACGAGAAKDIDQRRVAKYEAAAEVNETRRINRDCAADGCPGIGYYCDATQCFAPRDQLLNGPPKTTSPVYTPSYGRSQFVASTLVGELLGAYDSFSAEDKTAMGLTEARKTELKAGAKRGSKMAAWWDNTAAAKDFAAANSAWSKLSAAERARFTSETGLGETAYTDMVRLKTKPPTNSKGTPLIGDARAALITSAIFSDDSLKSYLMGIFQGFDKFTVMAQALMKKNLAAAKAYKSDADEKYLAAMVARAHNGGAWQRSYADLITKAKDQNEYVENFIGTDALHRAKGDWNSLRCTDSFGDQTLVPGRNGVGIGGLQMGPLTLP